MPLPSDNPLTFRTTDMTKWGVGKGSRLTSSEVDLNFWAILEMIAELTNNPALPAEIESIDVVNGKMTIQLTNSVVFGPFQLPEQAFRWTGAFVGGNDYESFDVLTYNNSAYLVLQAHTAASIFDPAATNMSGPLYALMFKYQDTYDVAFFYPGKVGLGLDVDETIFAHEFAQDAYFLEDLPGSRASFLVDPVDGSTSNPWEVAIFKNATPIGTFTFDPDASSGAQGFFTFAADVEFAPGDKLRVERPAAIDSAAKGFTMTFAGKRGTL